VETATKTKDSMKHRSKLWVHYLQCDYYDYWFQPQLVWLPGT